MAAWIFSISSGTTIVAPETEPASRQTETTSGHPRLRAHAKLNSHSRLPGSRHIRPLLGREILDDPLRVASGFARSSEPNLTQSRGREPAGPRSILSQTAGFGAQHYVNIAHILCELILTRPLSSSFAILRRGWNRQERRDQGATTTRRRRSNTEIGAPVESRRAGRFFWRPPLAGRVSKNGTRAERTGAVLREAPGQPGGRSQNSNS